MSQRKNFRLKSDVVKYLESYAKENGLTQTEAIEKIVTDHRTSHDSVFASIVAENVKVALYDILTRVRLGVNTIERNSMEQMELWNTILIQNDITSLLPTDAHKAGALNEAEKIVKERISNWRQAKLSGKKQ